MNQGPRNNIIQTISPRCSVLIDGKICDSVLSSDPSFGDIIQGNAGTCNTCLLVEKQRQEEQKEKVTTHAINVRLYLKTHNGLVTDEDVKEELLHQIFVGSNENIELDWDEIKKGSVQLITEEI